MDDELKKVIGGDAEETDPLEEEESESDDTEEEKSDDAESEGKEDPPQKDPQVESKKEQLANLDKAIKTANETLRNIRKELKGKKKEDDEDIPQINMDDPASKAWDRHIRQNTDPLAQELEREKEEVRSFALKKFLEDKPALAKDPEKLKAVISTYSRIKTATERNQEGVIRDLEKSYAAENSEELIRAAHERQSDEALKSELFARPGITKGSGSYSSKKEEKEIELSEEDKSQLLKWGMTPKEWMEIKKKYG